MIPVQSSTHLVARDERLNCPDDLGSDECCRRRHWHCLPPSPAALPHLHVVCGETGEPLANAARRYGYRDYYTSWETLGCIQWGQALDRTRITRRVAP